MQSPTYDKQWYQEQQVAYIRERMNKYQAATFIANRCAVAADYRSPRWLVGFTALEETATFLVCDLGDMLSPQTSAGEDGNLL